MERKNRSFHYVHPYASSLYGPRGPPFAQNSPRFLNPWPQGSPFRNQCVPHYDSCSGSEFIPLSDSSKPSEDNLSNNFEGKFIGDCDGEQSSSRDTRWQQWQPRGRGRGRGRGFKGQRNTPVTIEDYINDSMLEDPWAHLEVKTTTTTPHDENEKEKQKQTEAHVEEMMMDGKTEKESCTEIELNNDTENKIQESS